MSERTNCRHCGRKPSPFLPVGPSCVRCAYAGARAQWASTRELEAMAHEYVPEPKESDTSMTLAPRPWRARVRRAA